MILDGSRTLQSVFGVAPVPAKLRLLRSRTALTCTPFALCWRLTVTSRFVSFSASRLTDVLKGLSRVRGNSHARFLEGWAGVIPPGYSTWVCCYVWRETGAIRSARPSPGRAASTQGEDAVKKAAQPTI